MGNRAGSAEYKPNELKWLDFSRITGKKIIADCGYGVGGGTSSNCQEWNKHNRVNDGVVALSAAQGSFLDQNQLINISINFRIDISRSGLNLIVPQAFKNCETVLTINLSFNNLTQLNSKSFYGMVKLKSLNIRNNQISQLESDLFKDVHLLNILELNNSLLKRLDENLFYNLTELESINLSSNQIETIDA
ncbi:unnamed protein product [Brachionus calyciflorus]|uniref:Uncharacterized protein n=1 Tax=Brachionus calyciflorus TaxID=104777 RepID=A0A814G0L4_9BILA|nr:unnamed protein product [Brachionus calyciflorus]